MENDPLLSARSSWTKDHIVIVALNSYNTFVWTVYYTVMVPLLPLYAEKYGFGKAEQGLVLASLQFGWFLGLPLVNKTWIRPRHLLLLGAVSYVVAPVVVVVKPSLRNIIVGRIIEGFGSCLLLVLMKSVMAREIPASIKGTAFGFRSFFGSIGLFCGPLVGGLLYPIGGIVLPMVLLAVLGVVGLVVYITMVPEKWFEAYEDRIRQSEADGVTMWQRFENVLQERNIKSLLSIHLGCWFFLGMMFMLVPDYMVHKLKFTSVELSVFWLVCDFAKMFGALGGGHLADALQPWSVFFCGLALQHVAQLVLGMITLEAHLSSYAFIAACCMVFAFGTTEDGLLGPAYMKMLTVFEENTHGGLKDKERFEEILSLMEFMCSVGMTLGPLYAGFCYPVLGFATCILMCALVTGSMGLLSAYITHGLLEVHGDREDSFHEPPFCRSVTP